MSDVNTTERNATSSVWGGAADAFVPKFEMPRFNLPKFELPKMEVPAAFREFAEKSVAQTRDNWEKVKAATDETTELIEGSYNTASKGVVDYGRKLIELSRANTNSAFDYASQLMGAKSLSDVVEISSIHARKQFDALNAQSKELAELVQKVATDTTEPIKNSVSAAFKKVA
jgi:phasin